MSAEAIHIWRDSPYTMGASISPDIVEGEIEFAQIEEPCGFVQQFIAGLEAAEKLKSRLGMVGHCTIIWSRDPDGQRQAPGCREGLEAGAEEPDPADWWKSC